MQKHVAAQNKKYLKKVNAFNDTIQKIQSLVDARLVTFDPLNARVILHPYCLSSLATDENRKNYVRNLSLYYIVKYWEVFKADLEALVAPKKPEYGFTVYEQATQKPLAKYVDEVTVFLL